jgi:hypothetical protein
LAVGVLVGNRRRRIGKDLFMGGTLGGSSGGVMGRKSLRVDTADSIGPTAVMLDDLIGHFVHATVLSDMAI